jgi:hypothetical protein
MIFAQLPCGVKLNYDMEEKTKPYQEPHFEPAEFPRPAFASLPMR